MADLDVEVVLRLIDKLSQPAQQAAAKLQVVQQALKGMSENMLQAGRRMTLGFTLPAAGMVKQAVDFDTAMGNLAKVFMGTDEQLAKTKDQILGMARSLPLAQSELAKLFTAANQANIPLKEQADFVRLASEFMVAFDTSADKAAGALANLKASQDLTLPGLRDLAGVMNIVANNSAATEPQMLRLAERIAALGKVAGGEGAVAPLVALGGAAVSMGVDVERVSTALRNMLLNLSAGESGTKRMKDALQALGLEAGHVQQSLSKDTVGTMLDIFKRIQELPKAGQLASLNDLFGRRAVDALGPLLGNLPEVVRLLGLVADEQKRASSVSDEFAKRMERIGPQFQLFMNALRGVSMAIAEHWFGPMTKAMEMTRQFFDSLTPGQQKFAAFGAGITAALGPVLIILGSVTKAVSLLLGPIRLLITALGTLQASAVAVGTALGTGGLAGAIVLLTTAATGLLKYLGPAGLLVAGAVAVYQQWDKVSPSFNRVVDAVKNLVAEFTPLLDVMNKVVEKVTGSPIGELLNKMFEVFNNSLVRGIVAVMDGVASVIEKITAGVEKLKGVLNGLGQMLPGFGGGNNDNINPNIPPVLPQGNPNATPVVPEGGENKINPNKGSTQKLGAANGTFDAAALRQRVKDMIGSEAPATQTAAAMTEGVKMPSDMTLAATGPRIEIRQAPPTINNTVTVNMQGSSQSPEAVGRSVAMQMDRLASSGLYDGVNEA